MNTQTKKLLEELKGKILEKYSICKHNFKFKNTMAGKYREQGMNMFAREITSIFDDAIKSEGKNEK